MKRCSWANSSDLEKVYHDHEWGVPCHQDQALFEYLSLELLQSGLSWSTILKKRATISTAFAHWDFQTISTFDERKIEELLQDPGIIRHRKKIESIIHNAGTVVQVIQEYGSFDQYIWSFVEKPISRSIETIEDRLSQTSESKKMSQELKKQGFKFLGPTTVYSFMQAIGMVNDHENHCFRKWEVESRGL